MPDIALFDLNQDGDSDALAVDLTGNGEFNFYLIDHDGNGIPDQISFFKDGGDAPVKSTFGPRVEAEMKKYFRPEFLNRIDDIIVFRALTEQDIEEVARRMLKTVENRMESMDIHLDATEEAVKELAREGFDPKYGARPLRRAIQSKVEDAVAEKMLDGTLDTGDTAKLTVEDGKLVVTK